MKQHIDIEYTEKEFETVFNFFSSIVNSCSSFAHKAMEMENDRRTRFEQKEKHDQLKSKIKEHKEEVSDMIDNLKEEVSDLQDVKRAIRDIQRTLATLSLQIQTLEDDNVDLSSPNYPGTM